MTLWINHRDVSKMVRKPVVLDTICFASRKEANSFFSAILNAKTIGQELAGEEFESVFSLLASHPSAAEKIGPGIDALYVGKGFHKNSRCFHIRRIDGSTENFSIGKCLRGENKPFQRFCIAARRATQNELRAFKRKYFEANANEDGFVRCQECGELLDYETAHVDHRLPMTFSVIAYTFVKATRLDLSSVEYLTENVFGNIFADPGLRNAFADWHRKCALLRIVKGKRNLERAHFGKLSATSKDQQLQNKTENTSKSLKPPKQN